MSKGTRYQLYLALHIAGYHEFAERHETLPFVADGIMETFDDDRSAEASQLLCGIAEKGQVIYLTHDAPRTHARHCIEGLRRQGSGARVACTDGRRAARGGTRRTWRYGMSSKPPSTTKPRATRSISKSRMTWQA